MSSNFRDVQEFNFKFGLYYDGPPKPLTDEMQAYRIKFMQEELNEYSKACITGDMEGQFDALLDLVYVAMGTAVFHGFPWQAGWDEVQRANLSKVRATHQSQSKRGTVYDVIKPPEWRSPDIAGVLEWASTQWGTRKPGEDCTPRSGQHDAGPGDERS